MTDYSSCTNAVYVPVLGSTARELARQRNCNPKKLRDNLSTFELAAMKFGEVLAGEKVRLDRAFGNEACIASCHAAGRATHQAIVSTLGPKALGPSA